MRVFGKRLSGLTGIPEERLQELMKVSYHFSREYESGLISSERFYAGVQTLIGKEIDRDAFIHSFTDIFTPIPSSFQLVKDVKPRYKLGLLSNTNEWHYEYGIRKVEIYPLFETVTLSYQVGAMKPDERIYHDALKKLGCLPEECVYIDDIPENAEAASKLGMRGIHYTTHEKLLRDLEACGVGVPPLFP